jgi:hypothetical protein
MGKGDFMGGKSYEPPRTADKGTLALTPSEALEMHVRAAERAHDDEKEFGSAANSAAVKTAEEAIKAALLINGGSSVAMLAFIGTLVSRDVLSAAQLTTITKPLLCFGCGVAASVLAAAAAYFTNLGIGGSSSRKSEVMSSHFFDRHRLRYEVQGWAKCFDGQFPLAVSYGV